MMEASSEKGEVDDNLNNEISKAQRCPYSIIRNICYAKCAETRIFKDVRKHVRAIHPKACWIDEQTKRLLILVAIKEEAPESPAKQFRYEWKLY